MSKWKEVLDSVITLVTNFGIKLIIALAVLIIGFKISKWISKRISSSKALRVFDDGLKKFLGNSVKICLYAVVIIVASGIVGIPYASFIAVLGSAGIAIGLALQGSLSNIAAGILILLNKSLRVGDFIEASGIMGTVKEIGLFTTSIITIDNKVVYYPNSSLSNTCVINYSQMEKRMVDIDFGVGYESDIDKVKEIIYEVANNHSLTLNEPAPFVRLSKHDDSALVFKLRVWCKTADYWTVYFDMMEQMKKAFDENGIEIPYSKLDVNIMNAEK